MNFEHYVEGFMKAKDISELCLTVIFQDERGFHYSYQLAYHPCPVWMNGPSDYKITMPESVNYEFGSFEKLLNYTKDVQHCEFDKYSKSIIVADEAWMSYNEEFEKIVQDIKNNRFEVSIMLI